MHLHRGSIIRYLSALTACLCSVGCTTISYVSRTANLTALPNRTEVAAAIRAVPEIQLVKYMPVPSESSFSVAEGTVKEPAYDQFYYRSANASGAVEVQETSKGEKILHLYCLWLDRVPTAAEAENARSLLNQVYESLHQRVPNIPPSSMAKDESYRIAAE